MKVEFFRHNIGKNEIAKIKKVLKSVFLTTGPVTKEFENRLSEYLGCRHVVAVTSCTAALFLSLKAYGIESGDEVITTPLTFIATPNSIIYTGGKPVFVDVEEETGNINTDLIEKAVTPKTKAIMPVHLYGQMCDMKKIKRITDKHNLIIIEDAAHALESQRNGIKAGGLGDAACFSFYATKNITCGEGGAIGTNNKKIERSLRKLRLHGMDKGALERYSGKYRHWDMELLGWKYNMDDIHSALLLNQLKNIKRYWRRREEISGMYEEAFSKIKQIRLLKTVPGSKNARCLFTILVPWQTRDRMLWRLQQKGIGVAVNYRAVHLLKYYRKTFGYKRGIFPVAESMGEGTISLPLYPGLSNREVEYVIRTVKKVTTV